MGVWGVGGGIRNKPREQVAVSSLPVLADGGRTGGEKRGLRWRREKRVGPESPDKGPLMRVN